MYDTIPDSVRMMKEMSQKIFAQPVLAFAKVNSENNFVKLRKTVTFLYISCLSGTDWSSSFVNFVPFCMESTVFPEVFDKTCVFR